MKLIYLNLQVNVYKFLDDVLRLHFNYPDCSWLLSAGLPNHLRALVWKDEEEQTREAVHQMADFHHFPQT